MSYRNKIACAKSERTIETEYMLFFSSKWLLALMECEIDYNDEFFDCIAGITGDLASLRDKMAGELKRIKDKKTAKITTKEINEIAYSHHNLISESLSNFLEDHPELSGTVKK